jgi:uncharacterized protein YcfJ
MHAVFTIGLGMALAGAVGLTAAQVTLYEDPDFQGHRFSTRQQVINLARHGFNDHASSAVVIGMPWEVCPEKRYDGRCVVLRQGRYPSLAAMGLDDRISSVRPVDNVQRVAPDRYAPDPIPVYDNRRRPGERLYQADVVSVRAVLGPPEQRCWTEPGNGDNAGSNRSGVGGAVVGALLGGILGHQVGGGSGRDLATAGGAVAGAWVGAKAGRDHNDTPVQGGDIRRCDNTANTDQPRYWDVVYTFRGQPHRLQMTTPPGNTVTVNAQGEPRT